MTGLLRTLGKPSDILGKFGLAASLLAHPAFVCRRATLPTATTRIICDREQPLLSVCGILSRTQRVKAPSFSIKCQAPQDSPALRPYGHARSSTETLETVFAHCSKATVSKLRLASGRNHALFDIAVCDEQSLRSVLALKAPTSNVSDSIPGHRRGADLERHGWIHWTQDISLPPYLRGMLAGTLAQSSG